MVNAVTGWYDCCSAWWPTLEHQWIWADCNANLANNPVYTDKYVCTGLLCFCNSLSHSVPNYLLTLYSDRQKYTDKVLIYLKDWLPHSHSWVYMVTGNWVIQQHKQLHMGEKGKENFCFGSLLYRSRFLFCLFTGFIQSCFLNKHARRAYSS